MEAEAPLSSTPPVPSGPALDPREVLQTMLDGLGLQTKVEVFTMDGSTLLHIATAEPGRLIGKHGQTLSQLQFLVNRILQRASAEAPRVTVDCERYRERQRDDTLKKVLEAADNVRRWGESVLRNPLAPIRNGLQVMRLANHDLEAIEHAREMMERQVGQMARLIDDLLDLSRITIGKLQRRNDRIDLIVAVQDALETSRPCIDAAGHELTVSLPTEPIFVDGDRGRLAQVFANLLNNSAKFTDHGGHIWLAVERQGSDVVTRIKDNGAGISAGNLEKIFDIFTQSERLIDHAQGGLGIGLNLVRGLVEMHGGRVEAHSDGPGKGAEFVVRLPVLLQYARKQDAPDDKVLSASRYRILVVDDNKDSAISLGMVLKYMGHTTRTAHDGLETLNVAEDFLPDVVLLDIGLPKLNGYEVCSRIRKQEWGQRMVLIALTGYGQDEDKLKSKEAGFNFHMVKPVDPAALGKLLDELLSAPI